MNENMDNILTLTDEEGFEVSFEIADNIIYDDKEFLVLLPDTDEEEVEGTIRCCAESAKVRMGCGHHLTSSTQLAK